ncbi:cache domain-containing protein [Azohydromonas sediminis]|uniref:cache domain-containing protein n=1 Tax=Azohydromonas sediminis TaxID=2259674 RepID=UPI000E65DD84|nr:cache domain-containing protein [Azohydromonas sediminis]
MLKQWMRGVGAAVVVASFVAGALAQEQRGTRDEAIAMTKAAFEHIKKVGAEQAYKDFTYDKANWTKKDLYVMVYDGKGIALAHGANDKLVGRDMSAIKDANGKSVITGLIEAANKGGGWFDYDWPHPQTKKIEAKATYAIKPPSGDGFVGVGIYR